MSPSLEENFLATLNLFKCICTKIFLVRKLERPDENLKKHKTTCVQFITKRNYFYFLCGSALKNPPVM